jgi:hypothetical protein
MLVLQIIPSTTAPATDAVVCEGHVLASGGAARFFAGAQIQRFAQGAANSGTAAQNCLDGRFAAQKFL